MPKIALTPYDRVFLAGHSALVRRGLPGHAVLAWIELRGPLDEEALASGLRRAAAMVPITQANLSFDRLLARAAWDVPDDLRHAEIPLRRIDVSGEMDSDAAERAILADVFRRPLSLAPPHVHGYLFSHEGERHHLALHWSHFVMDLEGGKRLLEIIGGDESVVDANDSVGPPTPQSSGSLRSWMRAVWRLRPMNRTRAARIPDLQERATGGEFMTSGWGAQDVATIKSNIIGCTVPGPARLSRGLLMATARAVDACRDALQLTNGDTYLFPLPMGRSANGAARPIAMNDLTIATIAIRRDELGDDRRLDASITRQINAHAKGGLAESAWAWMRYAGLLRRGHYEWIMRRGIGFPTYSVGFTSYRVKGLRESFLGCQVREFHAVGLPTIPPGLMLSFTRLGETQRLSAAWFPHMVGQGAVRQLIMQIGAELGAVPNIAGAATSETNGTVTSLPARLQPMQTAYAARSGHRQNGSYASAADSPIAHTQP